MTYENVTGVIYKSIPAVWIKERDGRKPNTFRDVEEGDLRIDVLKQWWATGRYGNITMENTETHQRFQRQVRDVTFWKNQVIISWEHRNE